MSLVYSMLKRARIDSVSCFHSFAHGSNFGDIEKDGKDVLKFVMNCGTCIAVVVRKIETFSDFSV